MDANNVIKMTVINVIEATLKYSTHHWWIGLPVYKLVQLDISKIMIEGDVCLVTHWFLSAWGIVAFSAQVARKLSLYYQTMQMQVSFNVEMNVLIVTTLQTTTGACNALQNA